MGPTSNLPPVMEANLPPPPFLTVYIPPPANPITRLFLGPKTFHTFTSEICPTSDILNTLQHRVLFTRYIHRNRVSMGHFVDILGVRDYFEDNINKSTVSVSDCAK